MIFKIPAALFLFVVSPFLLSASSETDRKIEAAAVASYNYRTVLDNHVKVKAHDGVVTLTGTVQDEDERMLAFDTVENLPGVSAVINELEVKPKHVERSDAWVAMKVRGRLLVKGNVSATNTQVTVVDGAVTLTGTANDLAQKELTGVYAREIAGVKAVENNLVVNASPAPTEPTLGEKIDDASITSQVKYALLTHESTSVLKTKVTTNDGAVRVSGEASSEAEKALVSKLAADVRGVKSVQNSMTVKS